MDKKPVRFEIQDLLPIGLTLIIAGIGIAYGISVVGDMRDDMVEDATTVTCNASSGIYTGCSADINASMHSVTAIAKIPEKMPLIVTVIVAAIIIGILVRYLMVRMT
jgi:hypothetical protein